MKIKLDSTLGASSPSFNLVKKLIVEFKLSRTTPKDEQFGVLITKIMGTLWVEDLVYPWLSDDTCTSILKCAASVGN